MKTSLRPTHIRQPGSELSPRVVAVPCRGRTFRPVLHPGLTLVEAVRQGFAAEGFTSGTVTFDTLALFPFAYVMPALSETPANAAFYSAVFRPQGVSRLIGGAMTFGTRDGMPFFHCHGLWRLPDGSISGGHILPEETVVAEAVTVDAFGLDGAAFVAEPDTEINFKVFGPIAAASNGAASAGAVAMRLRPNQDLAGTLEDWCAAQGIARARVHGGVGSTIGISFEEGGGTARFATEVYLRSGLIAPRTGGGLHATIGAGVVDYAGTTGSGTLERGVNPVLMTFELALEILD